MLLYAECKYCETENLVESGRGFECRECHRFNGKFDTLLFRVVILFVALWILGCVFEGYQLDHMSKQLRPKSEVAAK